MIKSNFKSSGGIVIVESGDGKNVSGSSKV
jgi:hypothetical protein